MSAGSGFWFLVANDLHYRDAGDDAWLERLARRMNGHPEAPELLLMLGDLADDGRREQLAAVRDRLLDRLAFPTYCVIGNHDYAAGDDRSAWDEAMGPGNFRFSHRGWTFLGLDTTAGVAYEEISIPESTLGWVEEELKSIAPDRPLIVFTHFPLAAGVRWRPRNAEALLDRFARHRLRAAFSGHFHGAVQQQRGEALLVNGRCCSRSKANHDAAPEKGYLLCRAAEGVVRTEFIPLPEEGV